MNRNKDNCFLCGAEGADSDDHNPPESLYYKDEPPKGPLFKVRAQEKCQNAYSGDEDYFVKGICTVCFKDNAAWRKYWNDVSIAIKSPGAKKIRALLSNSIVPVPIRTKAGIYLGMTNALQLDAMKIDNIIWKIMRAIYFKHCPGVAPKSFSREIHLYEWDQTAQESLIEFFRDQQVQLEFHTHGNHEEFQYAFGRSPNYELIMWALIFYNRLMFWCFAEEQKTSNVKG